MPMIVSAPELMSSRTLPPGGDGALSPVSFRTPFARTELSDWSESWASVCAPASTASVCVPEAPPRARLFAVPPLTVTVYVPATVIQATWLPSGTPLSQLAASAQSPFAGLFQLVSQVTADEPVAEER